MDPASVVVAVAVIEPVACRKKGKKKKEKRKIPCLSFVFLTTSRLLGCSQLQSTILSSIYTEEALRFPIANSFPLPHPDLFLLSPL